MNEDKNVHVSQSDDNVEKDHQSIKEQSLENIGNESDKLKCSSTKISEKEPIDRSEDRNDSHEETNGAIGLDIASDLPGKMQGAKKPKNKKLVALVSAIIVICIIVIIAVIVSGINEKNAYNKYVDDLGATASMILSSAAECEDVGNSVKQIWNSAIWDKSASEWDEKYRKYFSTDFNTALSNFFSDSETIKKIASIESERDDIDDAIIRLENPPKGCEKAYQSLEELYDSYSAFAQLTTNPTGSLQTFSQEFNTLDSQTVSLFETATRRIPEKK